jgi:hypothetical protein
MSSRPFLLLLFAVATSCSSSGTATLVPSQAKAVFPDVTDAPSGAQTITFTNTGGGSAGALLVTLTGDSELVLGEDGCTGVALGATHSCHVTVVLTSPTAGQFHGQLSVVAPVQKLEAHVEIEGNVTPAQLEVEVPAPVGAALGGSADAFVQVHNRGGATSGQITVMLPPRWNGDFAGCWVLAGGARCKLRVWGGPTDQPGQFSGTLTATATPGGAASAPLTVDVRDVQVVVADAELGQIQPAPAREIAVTITNAGRQATGSALTFRVEDLAPLASHWVAIVENGCGQAPLAAGSQCVVRLKTAAVSPGEYTSRLLAESKDGQEGTGTIHAIVN